MGKYSHVIGSLPKSLGTEPEEQAKVNAIKAVILGPVDSEEEEMSSEVIEELVLEIAAMQKLLNDALIRPVGANRTAARYAQLFKDVRILRDACKEQDKATSIIKTAYEQLLADHYEIEGITSLKLAEGGSVRVQEEPHGTVIDKDANRKWAIEQGLENLLTLPWQTVNALAKEALLRGDPGPDGVELSSRTKIVFTKA